MVDIAHRLATAASIGRPTIGRPPSPTSVANHPSILAGPNRQVLLNRLVDQAMDLMDHAMARDAVVDRHRVIDDTLGIMSTAVDMDREITRLNDIIRNMDFN